MTWPHVFKTSKVLSLLLLILSVNLNLVLQICLKFWLMVKLLLLVYRPLKLTVLNQLLTLNNSNMVIWLLVFKILKILLLLDKILSVNSNQVLQIWVRLKLMLRLLSQISKPLKQIVLKPFLIKWMTWQHVSKTSKVLSLLLLILLVNLNLVLQICLKF